MNVIKTITQQIIVLLELEKVSVELDENLFHLGLDSIKCISLIAEMEEEFDIVFDDGELLFEYFSTIRVISDRIKKKLEILL
jgi:acyl carrier protein